jgi:hypothetical protein
LYSQTKIAFIFIFIIGLWINNDLLAQNTSNKKFKNIKISNTDTTLIDTLSLVPGELSFYNQQNEKIIVPDSLIDFFKGIVLPNNTNLFPDDSVKMVYRVLNFNFYQSYFNKDFSKLDKKEDFIENPFLIKVDDNNNQDDFFNLQGLNKNGNISRGVNFGNNQDLAVNSNLNLELSGKISDNLNILAVITDNNIPIQPDGNTQQLQDFDQVYIQVFDENNKLTAGDFVLNRPKQSRFMNFYKRAQGANFESSILLNKNEKEKEGKLDIRAGAAISKGKFARNVIAGVEGNQGPYRLQGAENQTFIFVLSGTENVYIDGKLLTRGQENDYIIDYNTAELTFTSKQLITKDRRIVVEFQYSDQNYARSLVNTGVNFNNKKLSASINFYSEQDAKNQTLQQDLTDEQKQILSEIGDSIQLAVVPSIDSVEFSESEVLYALVDTLVNGIFYDSVFVYSSNPDSAFYRLGFSLVGNNRGNYVRTRSTANGRVFEWLAPINGIPQGNYEPVILLITPKLRQMMSSAIEYRFSEKTSLGGELAVSNNDINTFSKLDSKDNQDIALRLYGQHTETLKKDSISPLKLQVYFDYEQLNKNFKEIERFRSVEFERDWNILNRPFTESQFIATGGIKLIKEGKGFLNYELNSFNTKSEYNALKNNLGANWKSKKLDLDFKSSLLNSDGFGTTTNFFRQQGKVEGKFKYFTLGLWEDHEINKIKIAQTDSFSIASYQYLEWETYVASPSTFKNQYKVFYRQRIDYLPNTNEENALRQSTLGENYGIETGFYKNPNSTLKLNTNFRKLKILNDELSNNQPESTLLGRLEYSLRLLKGTFSANTFYEVGSGLEVQREFSFLEVPPGQGAYAYIGDLNNNGVKDLNEFEIAAFPDQARYIKIFTPTNNFIRIYTNQFNQIININPAAVWSSSKSFLKKSIAKFSTQSAYRVDRKTLQEDFATALNPFINSIEDTVLVTLNSSLRNTVFFNKTHPKYGLDHTYQLTNSKSLLVNGFDSRDNRFNALRGRWNISKQYMLNLDLKQGNRLGLSEFFSNRNFDINYREISPKFTYQAGVKFRTSLMFAYKEKFNSADYGGEVALTRDLGLELKYSVLTKGNLMLQVNYIEHRFSNITSPLAFEMLEGLQPGENITWNLMYQRNLSQNMQLSINYTGRTAESTPTVHTGGVQVRAFF